MNQIGVLSIIIYKLFLSVNGAPTCTTIGIFQKDIICKAGTEDYVLGRGLVSDNNRTTAITLRECRISDVLLEAFENVNNLQHIDLSLNKITKLRLGSLDGNHAVTYLNLSYNLLTDFELGLFDEKPNLEVLDLRGNRIENIELGVFDPLTKLRHLDLSNNMLMASNLNPYIFDTAKNIKFIDFSRNDMSGASEMLLHAFNSIDVLNLDRCFIKQVPVFSTSSNLGTLRHLIISTNQIENLSIPTTFVNLIGLEILDMTSNAINNVDENIFKSLRNLIKILLRHNKLVNLPDTLFQNMQKLRHIDISHNQLEHIPVNAFRGTKAKYLNLSNNRFTFLQDNFFLELKNSGATITKFFFNDNPWQCACLKQLLDEMKTYNVAYNTMKLKGEHPVCVTEKDKTFYCKRTLQVGDMFRESYDSIKF